MKKWALIFVCLLVTACSAPFSREKTIARDELLAIAPVGSDARAALPILEAKDFKCYWKQQSAFAGLGGKHDYLYCDSGERTAGFLITRRWQLALVHKSYIVTDAMFGISLTGL